MRDLAELAAERNIVLVSDEIYHVFCYDGPVRLAGPRSIRRRWSIDGFSKTYGMTGWRLGFVHGPAAIIDEMIKLQQYTFVCAPQPVQWAGAAAMDVDMSRHIDRLSPQARHDRGGAGGALRDRAAGRRVLSFFPRRPRAQAARRSSSSGPSARAC